MNNAQIFIQKLKYITNKNYKKFYDRDLPIEYKNIYVHDSLLGQNPDNWKYSMNIIKYWKKRYPNNNFYYVIHYSPMAYKYYKDNPMVLFENTINTDDNDLDKVTCFDTAHYLFRLLKKNPQLIGNVTINDIPINNNWKLVHLNGLDKNKFLSNVEKHACPNGRGDMIGFVLEEYQNQLNNSNINWVIE